MYPVVSRIIPKTVDAFAVVVEPIHAKWMKSPERIVTEPLGKSIHRFATVSRVATGIACLNQQTIHDARHITAPGTPT